MILPDTSGFLTDYHEMRKLNKTKGNAMKPDEFFECFFILGEEGGGDPPWSLLSSLFQFWILKDS